ncbi:hypothetical protein SBRY_60186 [Actinacidiphila bryophytorum]|uniref:Uncharacterized protein n=1 Tax=Actinacidiphila bryophytorum TaxID=1436133 RepID=A0A9W4MG26_9ACTN|nr:hypothetical protein SBRY_60186 [Actinacidiphila bryophytorum]
MTTVRIKREPAGSGDAGHSRIASHVRRETFPASGTGASPECARGCVRALSASGTRTCFRATRVPGAGWGGRRRL